MSASMHNKVITSNEVNIGKEIGRVLITESQIKKGVRKLADRLIADYEGRDLTIIGVLTGSLIFLSDLIRLLPFQIRLDTICASLYVTSTIPNQGGVKILKEISLDIADKDVLVVDDIIDTGSTMVRIMESIKDYNPRSLKSCVLLNKRSRRQKESEPDYYCFEISPYFVVGYGLDYGNKYRNLPYIAVLKE
ncbi:MAG TPA: hypoxanthine phosphoribosyltransferase [Candidatus Brocadiia bacterium]|nr:hypoxanthine phosphoribosyltransferase [Candidatus Brocadiales bacterium]